MRIIALVLCVGLTACAIGGEHLTQTHQIIITEVGSDKHPMTEACVNFSLSVPQVTAYFATAIVIGPFEEHDHYAWAPCYVRGTAVVKGRRATWEVRAGGTARVVFPNGEVVLLADPSQRISEEH